MMYLVRPRASRIVTLLVLLATPTLSNAQDRDWVVLPLPVDVRADRSGSTPALLSGQHLFLSGEPDGQDPTLGPLVPGRAAEEIVWRAVQGVEGTSATVDVLGDSILIRGSREARAAGAASLRALSDDLEALHFDLHVTLVATTVEGDRRSTVFDETRRARSGSTAAFGERRETSFLADFDVEVANEMAIADPVIGKALQGETLHLWVSSFVDQAGLRQVFIQGLLDIAHYDAGEAFEPDVFELGAITQPVVTATQILFAGVIDAQGALRVSLSGLDGELTERSLQIRAVASSSHSDAARIVDLGRGLWRGRLVTPHVIFGDPRGLDVGTGASPASLSQLFFATVGRTPGARPVLGEAIVIFDPSATGTARSMRTLASELDPSGPPARLLVSMVGLTATIPASQGALLRVARTRETSYVADYDPQVASTAALSDPISRIAVSGTVVEGVLRGGVFVGRGVHQTASTLETREASPADVGRIQLLQQRRSEFPLRVRSGEVLRPRADLSVEWKLEDAIEAPR